MKRYHAEFLAALTGKETLPLKLDELEDGFLTEIFRTLKAIEGNEPVVTWEAKLNPDPILRGLGDIGWVGPAQSEAPPARRFYNFSIRCSYAPGYKLIHGLYREQFSPKVQLFDKQDNLDGSDEVVDLPDRFSYQISFSCPNRYIPDLLTCIKTVTNDDKLMEMGGYKLLLLNGFARGRDQSEPIAIPKYKPYNRADPETVPWHTGEPESPEDEDAEDESDGKREHEPDDPSLTID